MIRPLCFANLQSNGFSRPKINSLAFGCNINTPQDIISVRPNIVFLFLLLFYILLFSSSSSSAPQVQIGNHSTSARHQAAMTATFRRALGQRFSPAGILFTGSVALREPCLFLPHLSVRDMRSLDWAALRQVGFRGVVLDKDNTLTAPYSRSLWPPLVDSLRECVQAFPGQVAVFSNSAGLREYDPDGSEARSLEESIEGIRVIRHEAKKPSGSAEEIERFFGCSTSQLLMIGDRYFTDVAYGNKNGFLTILTEPLCLSKEPIVVQQVRKFESFLVNLWNRKGLKPVEHPLQCEAEKCVKVFV